MPFPGNRRPGSNQGGASAGKPGKKSKKRVVRKPVRKKSDKAPGNTIENTGREAQYLDQLMKRETPVTVVLNNGEKLRGMVRYYDRDVFSVGPHDGGPKIFLRKESIRYLYEEEE